MRLGSISLWGGDLEAFRAEVRLAEELGYEVVGVGDSPTAYHEMVVSLTLAAAETNRATLAPVVTTPHLRHPLATALAISSLHDLTGGRVVLTIASGGGVGAGIGRPPAEMKELREYVLAVRSLLDGRPASWGGGTVMPPVHAQKARIFLGADGPRALRLAGEIADGVVMQVGSSMEHVDAKLAALRSAALEAGRDPETIEIWAMSYSSVRPTREAAIADVTAFLAVNAGLGMRARHLRRAVPRELEPKLVAMEQGYDPSQHAVVGGANARLLGKLGLVDFIAGLYALAGTPEEIGAKMRELEGRGVACLLVPLPGHADPQGLLRGMREAFRR
jgi:alkanesulfonate monooxygenase SsuD/methylene tetrahydromethanopterin reductase-like flavin-dependent oxidoreductase (luciferase family)